MSKKKNMYKLESLARLISGRTPEREQKEYYAETGTPWVKIENLDPLDYSIKDLSIHRINMTQTITYNTLSVINLYRNSIYVSFTHTNIQSGCFNKMWFYDRKIQLEFVSCRLIIYSYMPDSWHTIRITIIHRS